MKLLNKSPSILVLLCLFGGLAQPALAGNTKYVLDPYHTQVHFTWNHDGFSNPGATMDVKGGTFIWNAGTPTQSSVRVSISATSIYTGVPALDAELKSTQFFDVGKYPTITFKSTDVQHIGMSKHFRIIGNLTMHGITKLVTLHATLNKVGKLPMLHASAVGFDATATVKRSAFGLGAYTPLVSDLVTIRITVQAVAPAALKKETKEIKAMTASD
ncbi:MAG: YceI family protein [Gammaproteobacteria bacterium]